MAWLKPLGKQKYFDRTLSQSSVRRPIEPQEVVFSLARSKIEVKVSRSDNSAEKPAAGDSRGSLVGRARRWPATVTVNAQGYIFGCLMLKWQC
jgi:hypothetical protein